MPKDGPILMFAGNIGEAQGFNTIIKSASYLNDSGVKVNWVILGDGRQRELIEAKITDLGLQKNFFFLGSYPSEEMPYFFVHANAMVVSLKKNSIFSMTIPNKIQSYMAILYGKRASQRFFSYGAADGKSSKKRVKADP